MWIDMGSGVFIGCYVPVADRHLAVEMSRGTGDEIETYRAFNIIVLILNLPALDGNVGKYRQYNRRQNCVWIFT